MNELGNTLEDLLTEQQLAEYRSKEYPFNTNFLGQILKEKLKQDPDYEVWVPFFYCKYIRRRKDLNSPSVIHVPLMFISNKGKLVRYKRGEYLPVSVYGEVSTYKFTTIKLGNKESLGFVLHRALASVFTPLSPELETYHPKDLQVNHIDGIKTNFELSNLEWTTDLGNLLHAVKNRLIKSGKDSVHTKPVKGKIEFGLHAGHEFILHGFADYKKYRFTRTNIITCCKGRVRSHKNCSWSYATELDIKKLPHGLSEEMRDSLDGFRKYIYT